MSRYQALQPSSSTGPPIRGEPSQHRHGHLLTTSGPEFHTTQVPNCKMSNFFHFQDGGHTLTFCQPQQEMTLQVPSPPGTNSAGSPGQQLTALVSANSLAPSAPLPRARPLESTAAAPVGTPAEPAMGSVRSLRPQQRAPACQSEFTEYSFQADCEDCGHHRLDELLVN